jgi:hypothetical protein
VLYQLYNFPWPVQDRDFVLKRRVIRNNDRQILSIYYNSVEDARFASLESAIRGETLDTFWGFRCMDSEALDTDDVSKTNIDEPHGHTKNNCGRTFIEVSTVVDLKGALPTWLVNQLQKQWPSKTIDSLVTLADKLMKLGRSPHEQYANW